MTLPYAEVIGDPVGHSKSPLIHEFWLAKLGIAAEYWATRVSEDELTAFLEARRADRNWRGCNVTAPLKQAAAALVGDPAGPCRFVGAVNCITRTPLSCLVGSNSDVAGVAEALNHVALEGRTAVLIGAGGAARGALCHLLRRGPERVIVAARDQSRAGRLAAEILEAGTSWVEAAALDSAGDEIRSAALLVNATPMGMAGGPPMNPAVLNNLASGQTVFDMVYAPIETELLTRAREMGAIPIDGLSMLIGQAAPAFELFFGSPPPRQFDAELRALLTS